MPGSYVNTGSPTSLTLTHPGTNAGNEAMFVAVAVCPLSSGYGVEDFTRGLTYNGDDLVSLGAVDCTSDRNGWLELFYLAPNMAAGDNDLEFTVSPPVSSILMESASYSRVSQVTPGSVTIASGTGASSSATVQSAPSKFVVGAFACSAPILMQQIISFGGATGGSGVVSFKGQPATVAHDASASAVQSALQALSTIGTGNVIVTGSGPWTATFENALANSAQPPFSIDGSGLTGGGPVSVDSPDGFQLVLQNIDNTDSGNLLLIDSLGAASVTLTANTNSYATWADWGAVACSVDALGTAQSDHNTVVNGVYNALTNTTTAENQPPSSVQDGLSDYLSGQHAALTGSSPVTVSAADVNAATATHVAAVTQNIGAATQNIGGLTGLAVMNVNQALQRSAVGTGAGAGGGLFEAINFSSLSNAADLSGAGFTASSATLGTSGSGNPLAPTTFDGPPPQVANIGITSGQAAWQTANTFGYDFECYSTSTTTDYQVVSAQLASSGYVLCLFARSDATMGTCVVGWVDPVGSAVLGCYVSGSWTILDNVNTSAFPVGSLIELVVGNEATSNLYAISLVCNGATVMSVTDSGHISQVGSSNRLAGLGMVGSKNSHIPTYYPPPSISTWGVADNAPPSVIGSGFRAYRTSASTVAVSSGTNLLASSFFDTVQDNTADLTYATATNNKLTVSIAGWYIVKICLKPSGAASIYLGPTLYQNGTLIQIGNPNNLSSGYPAADTFIVYCSAGDYLQPGTLSSSTPTLNGEGTGAYCYWEVTLANCGTLS